MPVVLVTGFPGFLGSALVERLLDRYDQDTRVICLIQSRFRPLAEQRAFQIERRGENRSGRIELIDGDITRPGLGLGSRREQIIADLLEVYHLAAVYDLSVKREFAMRVNVEGTRNVLDVAEQSTNLKRFQYISTCYVSGRYDGVFTEADLEKGQQFNNHYEETKYLAEVEVQHRMSQGLPCTIFRPAIVVGHSETGETQKYDGPYAVLLLLMKQFRFALMPVVGNIGSHTVNIVPQDFVIDAISYLSGRPESVNTVYQLANPNPPTVQDLINIFADSADRIVIPVPLPQFFAKTTLEWVPYAAELTGIQPEGIDYFVHPTTYDSSNTLRDLKETTIMCPPLESYVSTLVQYVKENPDVNRKAMV